MPYQYLFTVFTPTYNRANTLHRVFESLKKQTFKDFEWLIIDDGSTDNTRSLVEEWKSISNININYVYQTNKGKFQAFNHGVSLAKGELFLTLDSDDSCVDNALEIFKYYWDTIPEERKSEFSAVTGLCEDQYGNLIGDKFPEDIFDSNSLESRYRYKIKGEKWGFQRTDILKQNLFPVIEGEKFIPEGIIWNEISRKYKTRYINESLRIYWQDTSENTDQLTRGADPSRFAVGQSLWCESLLNNDIEWFKYAPLEFIKTAIHYSRFSFHANKNFITQLKSTQNFMSTVLWFVTVPLGYLVYKNDKRRIKLLHPSQ